MTIETQLADFEDRLIDSLRRFLGDRIEERSMKIIEAIIVIAANEGFENGLNHKENAVNG